MINVNDLTNSMSTNAAASSSATATTANFDDTLSETKSLLDIFKKASDTYGVDINLLMAVGKAESNFNPNAVSRCGAQGIMQLMPATAASLGVTDSFDAEQNVMGGANYLSALLDKYDGNIPYALAAYNAGSGNVDKYCGIPPFEETQNYVKKITNFLQEGVSIDGVTVTTPTTIPSQTTNSTDSSLVNEALEESESVVTNKKLIDDIFSYEDYLYLIDMLLNQLSADNKEKSSNTTDNSSAEKEDKYGLNTMSYSKNILNLLNEGSII